MDPMARPEPSALQSKVQLQAVSTLEPIAVGLSAAIVAVKGDEPVVAVVPARRDERDGENALPCDLFSPRRHGNLESALRVCVRQQTGIELRSARQICTLGGGERAPDGAQAADLPLVAVCYVALLDPAHINDCDGASWRSWYAYFPWEDWRRGKPACLTDGIEPRLKAWAQDASAGDAAERCQRLQIAFGCSGATWDEEKALERYELLSDAGLLGGLSAGDGAAGVLSRSLPRLWHPMLGHHTRVLASAIGELRRSIKRQPVVFELMPDLFTLFELQKTVEAILGPHLHKQNFRRLVETGGLVEPTGELRLRTGGRPAQLYRFRRHVLFERPAAGVRIKTGRG